jgi:protein-tyrosine phosphatase
MAEALAAVRWKDAAGSAGVEMRLVSAGLRAVAGQTASPNASQVVKGHGGDLAEHRARPVADVGVEEIDLFVTMTRAHRDALRGLFPARADDIVTLAEFAGRSGDVVDPFGGGPEVYAESYDQIGGLIEAATPALRERFARDRDESSAVEGGGRNPEKGQSRA